MAVRRIIKIDTDKCNGCGMCVSACAEGALAIIDGKARLLRDDYCDGLGACIGHCPQDAIAFEEREAADFDHQAVQQHIDKQMSVSLMNGHGCPSLQVRRLTAGAGANMPSWAEGCD
ncbi:MAG: 4Fe-4S binding protein, partial [Negativicutes bacterium]|nr:4Fe-4S binding protein [Negativicutes bacterium]